MEASSSVKMQPKSWVIMAQAPITPYPQEAQQDSPGLKDSTFSESDLMRIDRPLAQNLVEDAHALASLEGLSGHGRSARCRLVDPSV